MFRKSAIVLGLVLLTAAVAPRGALALGGNLKEPSIAIPSHDGEHDAVAWAIQKALKSHEKEFAGGHFINAHSVLHFAGGTKTINGLLEDLSEIEGAVIRIRFSKDGAVAQKIFPGGDDSEKECDLTIDHNAWGDAHQVSITIYLGSDRVEVDELAIPAIIGKAKAKPRGAGE